jgi:V/A-type H+-transporting ATPase subunit E
LEQAIVEATAKLEKMSREKSSQYEESLGKLVIEAAEAVQTSDMEILANQRDHEFLQKELPELRKKLEKRKGKLPALKLNEETLTCIGGVIVQDKDKKRIFNNTFEARLTKTKQELGNKIFSGLFEGKDN